VVGGHTKGGILRARAKCPNTRHGVRTRYRNDDGGPSTVNTAVPRHIDGPIYI
jgi:hypothetical protein